MKSEQTTKRKFDANSGKMVPDNGRDDTTSQQRATRRRNRGGSDPADWSSVDGGLLLAVVAAVARHGYAIRFGYTKDMGAYAIGIIGDGEPFTEFVRPTEDIELYFRGLIDDYGK